MKVNRKKALVISVAGVLLVFSILANARAEQYDAMEGVNNVNVIFDMRDGVPQTAAVHMKLIQDTYRQLAAMNKNPSFVVVFMGGAVKLISSNRDAFSAEERRYLQQISDTISKMSKDGIDFEVCLAAANILGVDPAFIQSEIRQGRSSR